MQPPEQPETDAWSDDDTVSVVRIVIELVSSLVSSLVLLVVVYVANGGSIQPALDRVRGAAVPLRGWLLNGRVRWRGERREADAYERGWKAGREFVEAEERQKEW